MSDKILVATFPDDTAIDGIRILNVNLNEEQSSIVSSALMMSTVLDNLINYVWKVGDPQDWLFDKSLKSDIIIVNADSEERLGSLIGYLLSKPKTFYFGNLKNLAFLQYRAIYSSDDVLNLMEKISKQNG